MEPPRVVLLIALALPLVVAAAIALAVRSSRKRVPWAHRIVPVALVLVVSAMMVKTAFAERTFRWSESGIRDDTFGAALELGWSDIEEARLVSDVWRSDVRPGLRTNGTAYGPYRAGHFRLANGSSARVFMMTTVRDAIVLRARGQTFVYAPEHFEDFAATLERHLPVGH